MSKQLKKIVVRNVGVLKAFETPSSSHFEQLTCFYARNGRGKTTLSSILRSARMNDPAAIRTRRTLGQESADPEVTLIFENGSVRFEKGSWRSPIDNVDVFDGAFIAENLFAGEAVELSHDRGLFTVILGKAGVKLAKQLEFFVGAAKRSGQKLKEAEAGLIEDLPTNLSREEFFAYAPDAGIHAQIEQAEKALRGVTQADRLSELKQIQMLVAPTIEPTVAEVLASTVAEVEITARDRLAAHFKKFELGKNGEAWVKFGLEHVRDNECPFCGKPDVNEAGLVRVYGQIFGEAYKAHFNRIKEAADKVEKGLGPEACAELSTISVSNLTAVASWSNFHVLGEAPLPVPEHAIKQVASAYQVAKVLLDAKRHSPLIAIHDGDEFDKPLALIDAAATAIRAYNQTVGDLNRLIQQKKSERTMTEQQARTRLADFVKCKNRNDRGVVQRIEIALSAKRRDLRAKSMRTLAQSRLKAQNEHVFSHYHVRVNHYLGKFGVNFRISEIKGSMTANVGSVVYGLVIRGHHVARGRGRDSRKELTFLNALSTGDKTTLALAFFLADMDRYQPNEMKERIIVFDDPLSSHDEHRRGKTVDLLCDMCERCTQLIVFSHDSFFLRKLHLRCNRLQKAAYQIEFQGKDEWSVAHSADLNELCQSENARRIEKLRAYHHCPTHDSSNIAPFVRPVLETYYRNAYPAYFDSRANLGDMVKTIKNHGLAHPCWEYRSDLDSCNVNTLDQHHGDDPNIPASEPMHPDELRRIVRTCLILINAILPNAD